MRLKKDRAGAAGAVLEVASRGSAEAQGESCDQPHSEGQERGAGTGRAQVGLGGDDGGGGGGGWGQMRMAEGLEKK